MNEKTKDFLFYSMLTSALFLSIMNISKAKADQPHAAIVKEHFKTVINSSPYQVEVCRNEHVSGDKTGDTLKGAIIGGIIGNNVTKNVENGGAVGALLGGMLGHSNSNAQSGTQTICSRETRYKETEHTVYSHSTINFKYNGKTYTLKFKK